MEGAADELACLPQYGNSTDGKRSSPKLTIRRFDPINRCEMAVWSQPYAVDGQS